MAEYTATFETGVNGNAILAANPGSATAWTNVNDPANVTLTYSNVQAYQTLAGLVTCDATGAAGFLNWTSATITPAYSATHYGRIYVFLPSAPGALTTVVRGTVSATRGWELRITTGMLISLCDQGGTQRGITTVPANTNGWFRLEWRVIQSTSAGGIQIKLFNSPNSTTETETITATGSFSTLATTNDLRFGSLTVIPNLVLYMDNILSNDTGYPGPAIEDNVTVNVAVNF